MPWFNIEGHIMSKIRCKNGHGCRAEHTLAPSQLSSEPALGGAVKVSLKEAACSALSAQTIASARIGLPSGEAKIASAVMMAPVAAGRNPQGQPFPAMPAYFKIARQVTRAEPPSLRI